MKRFLQLHLLTAYPPSNLNRDDLGRPKTAILGGRQRLRISSQCLKRTWRTSDLFAETLAGHSGRRSKRTGREVFRALRAGGIGGDEACSWAQSIAKQFGAVSKKPKGKKDSPLTDSDYEKACDTEQLAHLAPEELAAVEALVATLVAEKRAPADDELNLLRQRPRAADIAMFGRMLAASPAYNVEAAVQVAHAITVNPAEVEDDYFSAVDDLNDASDDAGAGHIGEQEFGSGLYYLYICVNRELLLENLQSDSELACQALTGLLNCALKVAPRGKQNSFASRAYASYCLAELGDQQPRSLANAFLEPIRRSYLKEALKQLREQRNHFDKAYGTCADERYELDVEGGEGSCDELLTFASAEL